ncbi:cpk-related protein kinase 3 [Corchorus olitorius]|uniref:Cpk-related protein kinase 3 n=1 Tax=Corchorus olitorius TaxID=93759 RepID=A0A1R3HJ95_9ROSI|nr:cpk-related protein kinase 3 [Corchorus olitorius]
MDSRSKPTPIQGSMDSEVRTRTNSLGEKRFFGHSMYSGSKATPIKGSMDSELGQTGLAKEGEGLPQPGPSEGSDEQIFAHLSALKPGIRTYIIVKVCRLWHTILPNGTVVVTTDLIIADEKCTSDLDSRESCPSSWLCGQGNWMFERVDGRVVMNAALTPFDRHDAFDVKYFV